MKKWWYGIEGIEFIWRGCWSDPALEVDGTRFNVHDIEDFFWEEYLEDGGEDQNFDAFGEYLQDNADEVLEEARRIAAITREEEKKKRDKEFREALEKRGIVMDGKKLIVSVEQEWDYDEEKYIPTYWMEDDAVDILEEYDRTGDFEIVWKEEA